MNKLLIVTLAVLAILAFNAMRPVRSPELHSIQVIPVEHPGK